MPSCCKLWLLLEPAIVRVHLHLRELVNLPVLELNQLLELLDLDLQNGHRLLAVQNLLLLLVDDCDPVWVCLGPEPGCRRSDVESLRDLPLKTAHQLLVWLGGKQGTRRDILFHGGSLGEI